MRQIFGLAKKGKLMIMKRAVGLIFSVSNDIKIGILSDVWKALNL